MQTCNGVLFGEYTEITEIILKLELFFEVKVSRSSWVLVCNPFASTRVHTAQYTNQIHATVVKYTL